MDERPRSHAREGADELAFAPRLARVSRGSLRKRDASSAPAKESSRGADPRIGVGLPRRALAVAIALFLASPVAAEIYRWTDESGQLHFSQNLNSVPGRYRAQAEQNAERAKSERDPLQRYSRPKAALPASRWSSVAGPRAGKIRVAVQRAGTSMRVMVRLNGRGGSLSFFQSESMFSLIFKIIKTCLRS